MIAGAMELAPGSTGVSAKGGTRCSVVRGFVALPGRSVPAARQDAVVTHRGKREPREKAKRYRGEQRNKPVRAHEHEERELHPLEDDTAVVEPDLERSDPGPLSVVDPMKHAREAIAVDVATH